MAKSRFGEEIHYRKVSETVERTSNDDGTETLHITTEFEPPPQAVLDILENSAHLEVGPHCPWPRTN